MSSATGIDVEVLSETELIALACEGDANAFGSLYEKYIDQIYSYIYFRTSNGKDA